MSRPRLLFVDDEPDILELLALMFADCETRATLNVESAIGILGEQCFDLIVSDIKMPGASGLTLLDFIKTVWPALPVVIITGHYCARPAAENPGIYRCVRKPFTKQIIRDEVFAALAAATSAKAAGTR
ncbi:MAG: response regulator [Deltaproteobacteria bacterium]|nr:response regulator [Deltaproteobacteria bacterium]